MLLLPNAVIETVKILLAIDACAIFYVSSDSKH